jgi:hypothetical protein
VRTVSRLGELYPRIYLTTEEKARKTLSQGSWTIVTDVEATVIFFNLKPNHKWNRLRLGKVTKKIDVFKIPVAMFMGGCSYLGLKTQKMLENPNPILTDP